MKYKRVIGIFLIVSILVSLFLVAMPASPALAVGVISLSPSSGETGDTVTVSGSLFPIADMTTYYLASVYFSNQQKTVGQTVGTDLTVYETVGQQQISATGTISVPFVIPDSLSSNTPVVPGIYYVYVTVMASTSSSGANTIQTSATFTVTGANNGGDTDPGIETSSLTINTIQAAAQDYDFTATIEIDQVTELNSAQYDIWFNPTVLRLDNVTGGMINETALSTEYGFIGSGHYRIVNAMFTESVSGSGSLAVLHFHTIGALKSQSDIYFSDGLLVGIEENTIPSTWMGNSVLLAEQGDANGDDEIDVKDMTRVARIILNLALMTTVADANLDGYVNVLDITEIARMILNPTPINMGQWSAQSIPASITNQLAPGTDAAFVTVASNGDIFAVDTASANDTIYKSVNGGRTWSATIPDTVASAPWGANGYSVTAIAVSPAYATDGAIFVLATGGGLSRVYLSYNGGTTFSALGGMITGTGTSIALAPNYSAGVGEMMVGTNINVYIWGKNGVLDWKATGLTDPVTSVAYSPFYQIDGTRLAVSANASGTLLNTLVAGEANWNTTINTIAVIDAAVTAPTRTVIAVPSHFNSTSLFTRTVYVGVVSAGATDNVYRQNVGSAAAAVPLDPLSALGITDQEVTSLAYSGTLSSGTLYAGSSVAFPMDTPLVIYTSEAPTASEGDPPNWSRSITGPTGQNMPYVALSNDFVASNTVYVGTSGVDSALSVSTDGGLYYHQAGLIDTSIINITDFQAPVDTDYFLATTDGATTSVWRSLDSGASWYRILSVSGTGGIIRPSPDYATDSTIVFGQVDGTTLKVSNNKGESWNVLVSASPVSVADIAVKDRYTFYIGSSTGPQVATTLNGGYYFTPQPTTIDCVSGYISSLEIEAGTGYLMAVSNLDEIALSTDGNATWTPMLSLPVAAGPVAVTFSGLGDNDYIYAASTITGGDIYRWQMGVSTGWEIITQGDLTDGYNICGLSIYSGILFALGTDGVYNGICWRTIHPTEAYPGWSSLTGSGMVLQNGITVNADRIWGIDALNNRLVYVALE